MKSRTRLGYCRQVQDENAGRFSMLVVCRKISSAVWKIFSTGHHLLLARSKVKVKVEQKVKFT